MTLPLAVTVAGGLLTLPLALWLDLRSLSERMLRLQADETGRIIDVMRDFYAKEVVARVQGATGAVTATHAYEKTPGGIPISATLSLELGKLITERDGAVKYRFVSDFPFRGRAPHDLDAFERGAIATLRQNPGEPVVETTGSIFSRQLRVVTPVVMGPVCVACHDTHPDSPKTDWKVGDVRGIQEVTVQQSLGANIFAFKYLLAYLAVAASAGFAFVALQRRQAAELIKLNAGLRQSQADTRVKTAALIAMKEKLRLRAERENVNKSKFLADAAHDLRQPMQALSNYLEAADSAARCSDAEKCVELIELSQTALRLARSSFRDVLEISQLESGFVRAEYSSFDVDELLDDALSQLQGSAAERRVQLRMRRRSGARLIVRSDRHLLGRVLMNLVSNAIKYKDEQKGDAAAVLVGAIAFPNRVRIEVVDNGVGIPRAQWGNIFKPFTQLNNPERDREKGIGLGLSIVSQILALLAGHRLDMNSVEGKGTRFSVEVPRLDDPAAAVQAASTNPSSASLNLAGLYVLYVEDDALVRKSTALLFDNHGVLHEDVASVSELEERLPTLERMPDLIVTDYRLPDGRTAEEVLKAVWKEYETALPAIVLTGEALDLKPGTWIYPEALGAAAPARGLGPLLVKVHRKPIAPQVLLEEISNLSRCECRSLAQES
jgi:signal transduction histidine kinase